MKYTTFDKTVYQLCEEIDYWKERAELYEKMYEEQRSNNNQLLNEQFLEVKKGAANALMLALSVENDEKGNLVINKEARKKLADNYIK